MKNSNMLSIASDSFIISILICLLIPLNLVTQNSNDFSRFSYTDYWLYGSLFTLVCSVSIFIIFWLISHISTKISHKTLTIVFGYLVICGLYFSIRSGVIDGTGTLKILWLNLSLTVAITVIGTLFFEKKFRLVLWFALAGATITTLIGLMSFDESRQQQHVNENFFQASSDQNNIFLISFDSLQADDVALILDNNEDLKKEFADFLAFTHVTAVAPFTTLSIVTTKLGYLPAEDINTATLIENHSQNFITHTLYNADYQISTYSAFGLGEPQKNLTTKAAKQIINIPEFTIAPTSANSYLLALKASLQKYIPVKHFLHTQINGLDFVNAAALTSDQDTQLYNMIKQDAQMLAYYKTDIIHFDYFVNHLTASATQPTAHLHHYLFTHDPANFDANCRYRIADTIEQNKLSALQQTECSIKKFITLLKKLKAINAFNNSLIIFTSDHGYECNYNHPPSVGAQKVTQRWCLSRYMPMLMIKPIAANTASLTKNDVQVSLIDISKTICEQATPHSNKCKKYTGINLLDNRPVERLIKTNILITKAEFNPHDREYNAFRISDIGSFSLNADSSLLTKNAY